MISLLLSLSLFLSPSFFFLLIYLMKKLGHVSDRESHGVDFVDKVNVFTCEMGATILPNISEIMM